MTNTEMVHRRMLEEDMEDLVKRWASFAIAFHGDEYTDGEHAFGVLAIEYQELLERVEALGNLIQDFREKQVMQHNYFETKELMDAIYDQARFAAEEAAQVAAVAKKAKASGFVRREKDEYFDKPERA